MRINLWNCEELTFSIFWTYFVSLRTASITSSHMNVMPPSLSHYSILQSTQFFTSELNGTVHLLTTLYRTVSKLSYDVCYLFGYFMLILYRSCIITSSICNRIYVIAFYSVLIFNVTYWLQYTNKLIYILNHWCKKTRWLYCVECPEYSIRLKTLGCLCISCLLHAFDKA